MSVNVAIGSINQKRIKVRYRMNMARNIESAIGRYRIRITIPKRNPMAE
jgi:hypothetical protein